MVDYYDSAGEMSAMVGIDALDARWELTRSKKLVLVMVGLPARGKSFIAGRMMSFLFWLGYRVRVFNAGQSRRKHDAEPWSPGKSPSETSTGTSTPATGQPLRPVPSADASFFDSQNQEARLLREQIAMETLDELLTWLEQEGDMGIFDATNSTVLRRRAVTQHVRTRAGMSDSVNVIFIESICDDGVLLEANLRTKVRSSPDFKGMDEEVAMEDMRQRTAHYEKAYESVRDEEGSYIKIYNLSDKVAVKGIFGLMSRTVLPYLMAVHPNNRPVFLVALAPREGERKFSFVMDEDELSPRRLDHMDTSFGVKIARWAADRVAKSSGKNKTMRVLASTQPGAIKAANKVTAAIGGTAVHRSALNPLDRGIPVNADDDTRALRFTERAEGGESYEDLVRRLEPCLVDIEGAVEPILIISHVGPCRALHCYFLRKELESTINDPKTAGEKALANRAHCVVELRPKVGGGWLEQIHDLDLLPDEEQQSR